LGQVAVQRQQGITDGIQDILCETLCKAGLALKFPDVGFVRQGPGVGTGPRLVRQPTLFLFCFRNGTAGLCGPDLGCGGFLFVHFLFLPVFPTLSHQQDRA